MWEGILGTEKVCVKVLRIRPAHEGDHKKALAEYDIRDLCLSLAPMLYKPFYREAVVWKRLRYPNVVSFLGVTVVAQLQLELKWVPSGTLTGYVNAKPHVDRISLVSVLSHRIFD